MFSFAVTNAFLCPKAPRSASLVGTRDFPAMRKDGRESRPHATPRPAGLPHTRTRSRYAEVTRAKQMPFIEATERTLPGLLSSRPGRKPQLLHALLGQRPPAGRQPRSSALLPTAGRNTGRRPAGQRTGWPRPRRARATGARGGVPSSWAARGAHPAQASPEGLTRTAACARSRLTCRPSENSSQNRCFNPNCESRGNARDFPGKA